MAVADFSDGVGPAPGVEPTPVAEPAPVVSSAPVVRVISDGVVRRVDVPLGEVAALLGSDGESVWVHLHRASEAQLSELASSLGFHELAVRSALAPHQRSKLDHFASHLFLAGHQVSLDSDTSKLQIAEVDSFIGDRWVITLTKSGGLDESSVLQRLEDSIGSGQSDVAFVIYALMDTILEGYFDVVEAFEEYFDNIAAEIFDEEPLRPDEQRQWFSMRQALIGFHRLAFPLREAIGSLIRDSQHLIGHEARPYYQDLYDHVLRITESTESLRDLVSTIVETNLSLRDYRQNQVMKKVTSWAGIIAVPTLVTGFYGMNVEFPSIATGWGALIAVVLMVSTSLLLYIQFKRRDWL